MSKRSLDDIEIPGKNKKVTTQNDVNSIIRGNINYGEVHNTTQIYNHHECQREQRQSITDTCIEFEIYEEIQKNENRNNFFFDSISKYQLSAAKINKIFLFLINHSSTEFLDQVASSTINKWTILDMIEDSTQIKELLSFFNKQLKYFSKVLYNEQNDDGENLLHILSKLEDLTVLRHFMEILGDRIKSEASIQLLKSTRGDGSNFFHVICSRQIENPDTFLKIIGFLQKKIGKQLITDLVRGKTNQGEDLFNVISKNQESETFLLIWDWFMYGYQDIAKEIAEARDNDGQNIPQTMFEFNSSAQKSIPSVIRSINIEIRENPVLEDLVTGKNKRNNNLCHMVFEANRRLFLDILQMKELDKNLIEKIFFLPGSNNERVMDKLCKNITHFQDAVSTIHNQHGLDITRSILYNGDEIGNPVLLKIINENEMDIALQFLDWVLKEYRELFTFDWLRKRNGNLEIVQDNLKTDVVKHETLCQWVFENLNKGFVENITKEESKQNGNILLYYSEINHEALFWSFFKTMFDKLDQNVVLEVLNYTDNGEFNFLNHLCLNSWKISIIEVIKLFNKNLKQNVVEQLLLPKQNQADTFLHYMCRSNDKTQFKELLELLFDKFNKNFVEQLFLSKYEETHTFLHLLCRSNDKTPSKELLELLLDKLEKNVVEQLFLSKQDQGFTFLHYLCRFNEKIQFKDLLELLFEKLNQNVVEELLLSKEDEGYTFLQYLSRFNNKTQFKELFEILFDKLEQNIAEQLLLSKEEEGHTVLHLLCRYNDKTSFKELLELFFDKFQQNVVKELLLSKQEEGYTFLHLLCRFNNETSFKELLELLFHKLEKNVVEQLLLSKQEHGNTFLQYLCQYNDRVPFKELLDCLFDKLEENVVEQLLLSKQNQGLTFFHLLCRFNNKTSYQELLELLFTKRAQNVAEQLLLSKEEQGHTFLHLLCRYHNEISFKELLEFIFYKLEQNAVQELLVSKQKQGFTFLHILCRFNNKTSFKELLEVLFDKLEQNVVEELLLSKQKQGYTFLHYLSRFNDQTQFKELLELLFDKLELNVVEELLFMQSADSCTFFEGLFLNEDKYQYEQVSSLLQIKFPSVFEKLQF